MVSNSARPRVKVLKFHSKLLPQWFTFADIGEDLGDLMLLLFFYHSLFVVWCLMAESIWWLNCEFDVFSVEYGLMAWSGYKK